MTSAVVHRQLEFCMTGRPVALAASIERAAAKSFVDWAGGSGLHRPLGITTLTVTRLSSLPYALPSPGKLAQSAAQSHQLP